MIETKDVESKGEKDDKKRRGKVEFRGGGEGGRRQGQRKEEKYDDEERSERRKWMNMCREIKKKKGKIKAIFFTTGHKRGRKEGLRKS